MRVCVGGGAPGGGPRECQWVNMNIYTDYPKVRATKYVVLWLFNENVLLYQVKSVMFFNVGTTY